MKLKSLALALSAIFITSYATATSPTATEAKPAAAAPSGGGVGVGNYKPYTKIVDYDYVKPHATPPIDRNKNAWVIDARPTKRYDVGHIPGAINIPDPLFDKMKDRLPADKGKEIIFYCQGPACELSHQSAYKAEALGYTNVKVYQGGMPDWEAKGGEVAVSTEHVAKLLADKADVLLVDSRPERVFEKGSLPGAINIPDPKFDPAKLPADKAKPIIFFCGGLHCDLSSNSARKARAAGYTNVKTYPEGYPAWQAAAKPVAAPAAAASAPAAPAAPAAAAGGAFKVETGKDKEVISTAFFERIMRESPDKLTVIDVRKLDQCKAGTWPGALCIPYEELERKLPTLPKDKPIVFVCGTGAKASMAYDLWLEKKTPGEAYILDAESEFVDGRMRIVKK
ncbi:MAG: rhodanese-like domain-containing protein [Thiobacillaceae bacterium]|nr:rhodanese-like domain-containing protein [Thiobacillaceae bacterium]